MARVSLSLVVLFIALACYYLAGRQAEVSVRGAGYPAPPPAMPSFPPLPPQAAPAVPLVSPARRAPAAAAGFEELEAESSFRWNIKKRTDGTAAKISEGKLFLGAAGPLSAAQTFVARFGQGVFGFDPGTAGSFELSGENDGAQVVVSQNLHGLPVLGARTSLFFDSDSNLVYAVSDMYRGPLPPAPAAQISAAVAAQSARAATLAYLGGKAFSIDDYPVIFFQNKGALAYRMAGPGLSLVYRYEFALREPHFGDMEVLVDASLGLAVVVRNQTRR